MVRRLSASALLALVPSLAFAAASDVDTNFAACAKNAHGATYPMLHCYSEEMRASDAAMTDSYKDALAHAADPATKRYLARSQTAWVTYRDAWCEATVSRSGSLARLKLMECRIDETKKRTAALTNLAAPQ